MEISCPHYVCNRRFPATTFTLRPAAVRASAVDHTIDRQRKAQHHEGMRGQLVILELLAGIFGWVWIAAGIATLICVGFALFGDWSWWNVLYAAIVGGISKWLASGFLDNKRRVLYEQKLIDEGLTKEEAAQRWFEEY